MIAHDPSVAVWAVFPSMTLLADQPVEWGGSFIVVVPCIPYQVCELHSLSKKFKIVFAF